MLDYKDFTMKVSTKMQTYRNKNGLTQKQMAKKLGVSTTYISNIERGKNKLPAYILYQYCDILGITPNKMMEYEMDDSEKILDDIQGLTELQQSIIKGTLKEFRKNNR